MKDPLHDIKPCSLFWVLPAITQQLILKQIILRNHSHNIRYFLQCLKRQKWLQTLKKLFYSLPLQYNLQYNLLFSACDQSKGLFECKKLCHCSASGKISYSSIFPCYTSPWRKKWMEQPSCFFFLLLLPIISHKPGRKNVLSFICFCSGLYFVPELYRYKGWGTKHILCNGAALYSVLDLLSSECRAFAQHVLQKEICFRSGKPCENGHSLELVSSIE